MTNVTYEVLQREYAKLRPQLPRFCGCETCRGDVLVYALNRLAPSYVSTPQGEVLVELRLDSDQEKAKLDVALLPGPDEWIGSYRMVRFTGTTGSTFAARPVGPTGGLAVVG